MSLRIKMLLCLMRIYLRLLFPLAELYPLSLCNVFHCQLQQAGGFSAYAVGQHYLYLCISHFAFNNQILFYYYFFIFLILKSLILTCVTIKF